MRARLVLALILIVLVCFGGTPGPVFAAVHGGAHTDWQRYDTVKYMRKVLRDRARGPGPR